MLKALRKRIAGYILGEQTALFLPTGAADLPMHELSDEQLGGIMRHFLYTTNRVALSESLSSGVPVANLLQIYSVSAWAEHILRANASELKVTIALTDANRQYDTTGNWQVSVTKLPDDYKFGPQGPISLYEGDKLVRHQVGWKAIKVETE